MHELSIAEALIDQVRRYAPAGQRILAVRIEIGARQSIEEDCLKMAWQAMTQETDLAATALELTLLPWTLTCGKCKRTWTSARPLDPCTVCGADETQPTGSNDLRLLSLEVDDGTPGVNEALPAKSALLSRTRQKTAHPPRFRSRPAKPHRSSK